MDRDPEVRREAGRQAEEPLRLDTHQSHWHICEDYLSSDYSGITPKAAFPITIADDARGRGGLAVVVLGKGTANDRRDAQNCMIISGDRFAPGIVRAPSGNDAEIIDIGEPNHAIECRRVAAESLENRERKTHIGRF